MSAPICFLTSIVDRTRENQSKWGCLARKSDNLLAWGRHIYVLADANNLMIADRPLSSGKEKLCRFLLIITVITPIFALIIKVLDRTPVDYRLPLPERSLLLPNFEELVTPTEIQRIIDKNEDTMTAPIVRKLLEIIRALDEYRSQLEPYQPQIR